MAHGPKFYEFRNLMLFMTDTVLRGGEDNIYETEVFPYKSAFEHDFVLYNSNNKYCHYCVIKQWSEQ